MRRPLPTPPRPSSTLAAVVTPLLAAATAALAPALTGALALGAASPAPAAAQDADGYVVRDLAPGVFAAVAPEGVPSYLFANSLVVIGDDGVLVVDSGDRPALARALIALVRERTELPVRWVVNTHWHGDHVRGNAVFREAFPEVRILATPTTRDSIATGGPRQVAENLARQRDGRARLAAMMDTADAALEARIRVADSVRVARIEELESLEIVLPDELFTARTELDLGGRRAVLIPLGPAHTPSDAVVWLPDAGILGAGDLLEEGQLWLKGADIAGWLGALDTLSALEPRTIVAAHGAVDADGALLAAARAQLQAAMPRDSADILFSITGLDRPEAVRYDAEQDVYFVASFGASEEDPRDGNGYISRVNAADGTVLSQRFMTGTTLAPLHMPRGMAIRGDTLWVADVDGVHGFLRRTGRPVAFVDFTAHEPGFLNDIAIGPDGLLYVTDTGRSRVHRIRADGVAEIAIEDARTGPPNGITWDAGRGAFLLAPWGDETMLRSWDPATGEFRDVVPLPGGHFDGIEVVGDGVLIASQDDTSLHLLDEAGVRRVIITPGRPADLGIDTRRGRVAVPYIALGRVDVWSLDR